MSNVTVVHKPAESRFEAVLDGETVGVLSYDTHGSTVDLQHTVVDPAQRGAGIGGALVEEALAVVRANKLKARPTCPFVVTYVAENPQHADLLEPSLTTEDEADEESAEQPAADDQA